uniref:Uncharacterized protein n=1 Tax=Anopheles atroparvus TaxID=41427 RepID=A0AAG5DDB2_ANOAO
MTSDDRSRSHAAGHLEEVSQNLATEMLPSGLFVVHDSTAGSEHDVSELTRR